MSFQLVSTYIIVFFAFGYTFYQFLKLFLKQKSSCGGSCGGCDFKRELNKRNISSKAFTKTQNLTYIKN
ncbi:MAG: FeoB-associated Cys-rich membrane protein [Labilibaculum antarcticum]|uniref:FeoB-associated Cys-rich membrane protein n=1 Tax=Labilibaculum antarcticum TaxID=1717717 RepID=UPI000BBB1030